MIVISSSIHKLQLGFVNILTVPIGFSCFTTLNDMRLRGSVRDMVELKFFSKWALNVINNRVHPMMSPMISFSGMYQTVDVFKP